MLDNILYAEKTEDNKLILAMEKSELELDRAFALYNTFTESLNIDLREAELRCFEESGDIEVLEEYYSEAEEAKAEKKKGILKRIWDAIVKFIKDIKNALFGKEIKKAETPVEAPKGMKATLSKAFKKIKSFGSSLVKWIFKHKALVIGGGAALGAIAIFFNRDKIKNWKNSKEKETMTPAEKEALEKAGRDAVEAIEKAAEEAQKKIETDTNAAVNKIEKAGNDAINNLAEADKETMSLMKKLSAGVNDALKLVMGCNTPAGSGSTSNQSNSSNSNSSTSSGSGKPNTSNKPTGGSNKPANSSSNNNSSASSNSGGHKGGKLRLEEKAVYALINKYVDKTAQKELKNKFKKQCKAGKKVDQKAAWRFITDHFQSTTDFKDLKKKKDEGYYESAEEIWEDIITMVLE